MAKLRAHLSGIAEIVNGGKSPNAERAMSIEKEFERRVTELSVWMDSQLASFGTQSDLPSEEADSNEGDSNGEGSNDG